MYKKNTSLYVIEYILRFTKNLKNVLTPLNKIIAPPS